MRTRRAVFSEEKCARGAGNLGLHAALPCGLAYPALCGRSARSPPMHAPFHTSPPGRPACLSFRSPLVPKVEAGAAGSARLADLSRQISLNTPSASSPASVAACLGLPQANPPGLSCGRALSSRPPRAPPVAPPRVAPSTCRLGDSRSSRPVFIIISPCFSVPLPPGLALEFLFVRASCFVASWSCFFRMNRPTRRAASKLLQHYRP